MGSSAGDSEEGRGHDDQVTVRGPKIECDGGRALLVRLAGGTAHRLRICELNVVDIGLRQSNRHMDAGGTAEPLAKRVGGGDSTWPFKSWRTRGET